MASKENRGGNLTNEQVEQELNRTGATDKIGRNYRGSQDTGEETIRHLGTEVQRNDGAPPEESTNKTDE